MNTDPVLYYALSLPVPQLRFMGHGQRESLRSSWRAYTSSCWRGLSLEERAATGLRSSRRWTCIRNWSGAVWPSRSRLAAGCTARTSGEKAHVTVRSRCTQNMLISVKFCCDGLNNPWEHRRHWQGTVFLQHGDHWQILLPSDTALVCVCVCLSLPLWAKSNLPACVV